MNIKWLAKTEPHVRSKSTVHFAEVDGHEVWVCVTPEALASGDEWRQAAEERIRASFAQTGFVPEWVDIGLDALSGN